MDDAGGTIIDLAQQKFLAGKIWNSVTVSLMCGQR
jgi:hypothetical protein